MERGLSLHGGEYGGHGGGPPFDVAGLSQSGGREVGGRGGGRGRGRGKGRERKAECETRQAGNNARVRQEIGMFPADVRPVRSVMKRARSTRKIPVRHPLQLPYVLITPSVSTPWGLKETPLPQGQIGLAINATSIQTSASEPPKCNPKIYLQSQKAALADKCNSSIHSNDMPTPYSWP
ncbi:hypothetical protein BO78DRAFT_237571 [Aspergillus sclerotiicarbonarius CBS 121057]|uniref:Uncharacterized protein n=1 Tax=Aspergillus sclerotiicarbonarius (strain CBS 121057 / IBT 28362) TaxID=1448318 RepID=A0A319EYW5_ASPSB|nr:hypothetical protein BO78DRAFT_237571 [Aspergillus sclerotiicarbonarius CBS 121057]